MTKKEILEYLINILNGYYEGDGAYWGMKERIRPDTYLKRSRRFRRAFRNRRK